MVSRSIFLHLQKLSESDPNRASDRVWLDLRSIPPEKIQRRFPKIIQVCQKWGVDVFKQPIPVAPAAHYWMGGIVTDLQGQTSIPGLYAVGEVTSTGVHGANRLASNSLLECLVFGAQFASLGKSFQRHDESISTARSATKAIQADEWQKDEAVLERIHQALPVLMWNNAGICRDAEHLESAIAQVRDWRYGFDRLSVTRTLTSLEVGVTLSLPSVRIGQSIRRWAETQNLLDNAYLILRSALFRTESRGGHYRIEYPHTDPNWQVHTLVRGEDWLRSQPIPTQEFGD